MEELRSTEILDKEIQADARRKAEKLLEAADGECRAIGGAVSSRVEAARKERRAQAKSEYTAFSRNKEAAVPLEMQRYLVDFEDKAVLAAINAYLESAGAEARAGMLARLARRRAAALAGERFSAVYFGLTQSAAQALIEDALGSEATALRASSAEAENAVLLPELSLHEGLVLEASGGAVRVRVSTDEIIADIRDRYSYELASTLFGGRLPE